MELKVLSCPGRTGGNAAPEMELLIPSDDDFFQTIGETLAAISSCVKRALLYSDQPHKRRLLTSVEAPPPYRLWTDKAWENGVHTEGPPVRRPIDFCLLPCFLPVLSQSLVSFLLIGPVSFTDSRINRSTSSHVCFWLYVTKCLYS